MILNTRLFLTFLVTFLVINFGICTEFVPVYMWGTQKVSDHVPALQRISEDSFKDTLLEYMDTKPYIVVFAENTLSPEDFAQHTQEGKPIYTHISKLKESFSVAYKPYVQNPIGAVKQLDKIVTELSIGSLLNNPNVPKDNILIIDLNDARENEHRFHMLKRHDADVVSIYKDIVEQYGNVLAIYTAHHSSWVAPEDVTTHKKSRSLLQNAETDVTPQVLQAKNALMYWSDKGVLVNDGKETILDGLQASSEFSETNLSVILTLTKDSTTVKFTFSLSNSKYWNLEYPVELTSGGSTLKLAWKEQVYAPQGFSYHCNDAVLSDSDKVTLKLPGLQVQPFFVDSAVPQERFGDAYDCVGFTSVPIWSGLFVTFILLLIMTLGVSMMMDIKTMDRFDDPKGKTITINAAE